MPKKKEAKGNIEIPLSGLDTGQRLCAKNIRRFIRDARLLLRDASDWHAIALGIFAFEELGKYYGLMKAKESAIGDTVRIDAQLFRCHEYKQKLARPLLPQEDLMLVSATRLNPYFQIESVKVSADLRLDCIFVNWTRQDGEMGWSHGSPVDPDQLKKFMSSIIDALDGLESPRSG